VREFTHLTSISVRTSNNASFFERQAMNKETVIRKLMEKGLIVESKKDN
jgi:hypothetical protein